MVICQYTFLSIGRTFLVATPYIVVTLLVLVALIILIRHFRSSKSTHGCCSAVGQPDHDNRNHCVSGHSCRNCSFSSCPTLQQGHAKKSESDRLKKNGV
ncbi:MAG: hypothetical protein SCM11_01635 [Bacillota bacterium]|nr:hypothetical protein [Bacillota bacterium]